jgi:hypothetical protein
MKPCVVCGQPSTDWDINTDQDYCRAHFLSVAMPRLQSAVQVPHTEVSHGE